MIIGAFAAGNTDALSGLLAPEPLANFSRAIEARRAAGQTMTTTLVSIDDARIVEAGVQSGSAFVSVRFAAKMTSVTMDAQGRVVEGSANEVDDHVEVWTFARPVAQPRSRTGASPRPRRRTKPPCAGAGKSHLPAPAGSAHVEAHARLRAARPA